MRIYCPLKLPFPPSTRKWLKCPFHHSISVEHSTDSIPPVRNVFGGNCPKSPLPYINYPARACASKGLCDRSWCLLYIYISARTFFYLSKYSLSDAHFSTGRLLFEFNRLQYTLAAPEVFVSSANPVSLPSGYRVSIVRNTNIDQIETTPLRYWLHAMR